MCETSKAALGCFQVCELLYVHVVCVPCHTSIVSNLLQLRLQHIGTKTKGIGFEGICDKELKPGKVRSSQASCFRCPSVADRCNMRASLGLASFSQGLLLKAPKLSRVRELLGKGSRGAKNLLPASVKGCWREVVKCNCYIGTLENPLDHTDGLSAQLIVEVLGTASVLIILVSTTGNAILST